LVKENANKTRFDLKVKKSEVVLILRMEGNPAGKWLVKDERGKIGFVDLSNIAIDPDSVKTLMHLNPIQALDNYGDV